MSSVIQVNVGVMGQKETVVGSGGKATDGAANFLIDVTMK